MYLQDYKYKVLTAFFLGLLVLLPASGWGQRTESSAEKPQKEEVTPPTHTATPQPSSQNKLVPQPVPNDTKPLFAVTKKGLSQTGNNWTDPVTGMKFVWVPGGIFQMGGGPWAGETNDNEKPVHTVRVDGFWLGKYEVTQKQWQKVMGHNPSFVKKGINYPVEQVSWNDVQDFIRKLNSLSGGKYEFKLPTEAEWEYAARSGGKNELYAGGNNVDTVAWYKNNSGNTPHPVGQNTPNGLSLYDMSGNVWEWCQDVYDEKAYSNLSSSNPLNTVGGSERAGRGGGWFYSAKSVRSTYRDGNNSAGRFYDIGFRLSRTP